MYLKKEKKSVGDMVYKVIPFGLALVKASWSTLSGFKHNTAK